MPSSATPTPLIGLAKKLNYRVSYVNQHHTGGDAFPEALRNGPTECGDQGRRLASGSLGPVRPTRYGTNACSVAIFSYHGSPIH